MRTLHSRDAAKAIEIVRRLGLHRTFVDGKSALCTPRRVEWLLRRLW